MARRTARKDAVYWWTKSKKVNPSGKLLDEYGCWMKKYQGKPRRFMWGWKSALGKQKEQAEWAWKHKIKPKIDNDNFESGKKGKISYDVFEFPDGGSVLVEKFVPDKDAETDLQIGTNIERMLTLMARKNRSEGRVGLVRYHLSLFAEFLENDKQNVNIINEQLAEDYFNHIGKRVASGDWAPSYANDVFQAFKQFVRYCGRNKTLAVIPNNILVGEELRFDVEHKPIRTIPRADLVKLWQAAKSNPRTMLFLQLGLSCAMTQKDISDLRKDELFSDGTRLKRRRSKLKKKKNAPLVNRPLWATTQELLTSQLNQDDAIPNAVYGKNGPLVSQKIGKKGVPERTDSVKNAWFRLCRKAGVQCSFGKLRKTSATLLRKKFPDMVDNFLGNAPSGVAQKHYSKLGERSKQFDRAMKWLERRILKAVGEVQP